MRHYTEGELLKQIREMVDRSKQVDVAKRLGVTPQYLNDILGSKRPVSENIAGSLGFRELPRRFVRKAK